MSFSGYILLNKKDNFVFGFEIQQTIIIKYKKHEFYSVLNDKRILVNIFTKEESVIQSKNNLFCDPELKIPFITKGIF